MNENYTINSRAQNDFDPYIDRDPSHFEFPSVPVFSRLTRALSAAVAAEPWILIIDVSHWNGDIDVRALIDSGVVAVIIKVSEGAEGTYYEFKDPKFEQNWRAFHEAGMPIMVYHFKREYKGSDEKSWFMKCADSFLQEVNGNTCVWLDCEWKPDSMTKDSYANRAFGFCDLIFGEGMKAGIYSSPYYVSKLFPTSEWRWDSVWQWNAHWTGAAQDTLPTGWSRDRRMVWQFGISPTHSWTPPINGAGTVDVNRGYWADANDLRLWMGQTAPPPNGDCCEEHKLRIEILEAGQQVLTDIQNEQGKKIEENELQIISIRNKYAEVVRALLVHEESIAALKEESKLTRDELALLNAEAGEIRGRLQDASDALNYEKTD